MYGGIVMDIIEAINTRQSIRAFKSDTVAKSTLEKILTTAIRAPSATNSQPWEFVVATGEKLQAVKDLNVAKFDAGEPADMSLYPGKVLSELRSLNPGRGSAVTAGVLETMGIARGDKVKRAEWLKQGLRFFGAPAAIFLLLDEKYPAASYFDIGIVSYGICLSALDAGLGTIINVQGVSYNNALKSVLGIPENKNAVISVAIGYPDWKHPVNQVRSEREPLEKITTWVGF
jgi:nitroreductase